MSGLSSGLECSARGQSRHGSGGAGCGVASLTISYYDLGLVTGEMALEILESGADISTMPVEFAPQVTKKYNAAICEELGIAIPEGYTAIG